MDSALGRFKWYRKMVGGHWEKWVSDGRSTWLRLQKCTMRTWVLPNGQVRSSNYLECDDYPTQVHGAEM